MNGWRRRRRGRTRFTSPRPTKVIEVADVKVGGSSKLRAEVNAGQSDVELTDLEGQRLEFTLDHIPENVGNALEVGFGDLRMTRRLTQLFPTTALDLPRPIQPGTVAHTEGLVFGTIERLPFPDGRFDLVLCCEVLEHLPNRIFQAAIQELQRVAGRYLLITVPYRQRVWNEQYKCPACDVVWHYSDHCRSLGESLASHFQGWHATIKTFGETQGYAPDFLYKVARSLGNVWSESPWGCHVCKASATAQKPNALGFVLQRVLWRWQARARRRPIWMLLRLERRNS